MTLHEFLQYTESKGEKEPELEKKFFLLLKQILDLQELTIENIDMLDENLSSIEDSESNIRIYLN